jgi:hypothetical protein
LERKAIDPALSLLRVGGRVVGDPGRGPPPGEKGMVLELRRARTRLPSVRVSRTLLVTRYCRRQLAKSWGLFGTAQRSQWRTRRPPARLNKLGAGCIRGSARTHRRTRCERGVGWLFVVCWRQKQAGRMEKAGRGGAAESRATGDGRRRRHSAGLPAGSHLRFPVFTLGKIGDPKVGCPVRTPKRIHPKGSPPN